MTKQEFYIWILNYDSSFPKIPEFNSEFLKNYEITKLVLEKLGINWLSENQQRNLNLEAVSAWFRTSGYIELQYDIPEILELLPERIVGNLNLKHSEIQYLPQLESVGGYFDLSDSKIHSLPELKSVGDWLYLRNSQIQFLPKLESVGSYFYLGNSKIESLPELKSVEGHLYLQNSEIKSLSELESVEGTIFTSIDEETHWKNYFNESGRFHLSGKIYHYD